ncbi:ubiquinol-cytochrome c reductase complex 7.3 kda protein-like protein [Alternaria alternata]|nr:ubiquinol-cytochrome c reductase complex 7.3 kda protein-like protein [Alternaria alternata]
MSAAEIPVTRELESCRRTSTFDTVSEAPPHHPPTVYPALSTRSKCLA